MLYLNIKELKIFKDNERLVDIKFNINSSTALIGQSGSGKSLTLKSLLNLLPSSLTLKKDIESNFELNYQTIGFVPQNPFTSLSPMTKIKHQFFSKMNRITHSLKLVNLDDSFLDKYPSQLSGGQLQRVIIAIALCRDIKLLLLDEPTTALDKKNQTNILRLINDLQKQLNILTLFVTHDIESIKDLCDDIVIINDGKIIQKGKTQEVLNEKNRDLYTKKLINSTFNKKEFRK
ncbi:MAG: ATP-binding cassette domain-containing protein [Campylobacterota bacterium]